MKKLLTLLTIFLITGIANTQTLPTAQQVYDNYLTALGGKQKLESIKTLSFVTVIYIGEGMKVEIETIKKGNKFKTTQWIDVEDTNSVLFATYAGKQTIRNFNGEKGYTYNTGDMYGDGKKWDFSNEEIRKMKQGKVMDALQIDITKIKSVEKSQLNGKDYYLLTTDDGKMYFDIITGLLYKNVTNSNEIIITKYTDVEGIKFVEEMKIKEGGKEVSAKNMKIVFNKDVSDKDFE